MAIRQQYLSGVLPPSKETPFSLFLQDFSPFVHALPSIACLLTALSLRNSWECVGITVFVSGRPCGQNPVRLSTRWALGSPGTALAGGRYRWDQTGSTTAGTSPDKGASSLSPPF